MIGSEISWLPQARRPTYYFLQFAKRFSPVYLTTEIDAEDLLRHRLERKNAGQKLSHISYVIWSVARSLRKYPEANASVLHSLLPRMARHRAIDAKFTVDKIVAGERVVVPGIVRDAETLELDEIQSVIDVYKGGLEETSVELKNARTLRRLPLFLGQVLYNAALANLERRVKLQGTFTVTSLGHQPVDTFLPVSSSSLCFGVGSAREKPVARAGSISVAPVMTLSMVFDHCALDGALAAELLADIKRNLEGGAFLGSH